MSSSHIMLQPWKPSDGQPFDRVKAAHLLNRCGFGATEAEIDLALKSGPTATVEQMLDFPDAGVDEQKGQTGPDLSGIKDYPTSFAQLRQMLADKTEDQRKELRKQFGMANRQADIAIVGWWLARMARGPHPLQEKLTLFWHGHFTTSARDERGALLMWNQNELLRRYAAGDFRAFVHAISRDPAMLDYLNNAQNVKAHPNENYARELMELFTLGIGHYSEDDVKQAARAFTGWTHNGEQYVFRPFQHDDGFKYFLGQSGYFNGDDVINIILSQQVCPTYIAGKLYRYFVSESLDDYLAAALGEVLRESNYQLRPLLRTMLTSRAFYDPQVIGAQIKSPVQLLVGTVRLLNLKQPGPGILEGALNQMGQIPLAPPNVKGWPGGHQWINTSTLFARYNLGLRLASGLVPFYSGQSFADQIPTRDSADATVDAWVDHLIQRPIDPDKRQMLIDSLGDQPPREQNLRHLAQLILSMPEYQLC